MCEICDRVFEKWLHVRKSASIKYPKVRRSNAKTCSKKCSKEYMRKQNSALKVLNKRREKNGNKGTIA